MLAKVAQQSRTYKLAISHTGKMARVTVSKLDLSHHENTFTNSQHDLFHTFVSTNILVEIMQELTSRVIFCEHERTHCVIC